MNDETLKKVLGKLHLTDKERESTKFGFEEQSLALFKDGIKSKFGVDFDKNNLDIKFKEAITGSGNELFKMDTVYSSSLFAFLFFSGVSKENPLFIDGQKYVESYFEFKNKVYRGGPSNMDVVLKHENGKELLFVECKFSEYLTSDIIDISEKYAKDDKHPLFRKLCEEEHPLKFNQDPKTKKYQAFWHKTPIYTTGIKQIIAHLIGIDNFNKKNYYDGYDKNDRRRKELFGDYSVKFIEIVFDFGIGSVLEKYHDAVRYLIGLAENKQLLEPTTYQEVLKENSGFKLNPKIWDFYLKK